MKTDYWNAFYSGNFTLDIPSQFCAMFCQEAEKGASVIEFGCGNGRDSRVMASHGFRVLGVDAAQSAIDYCSHRAGDAIGKSLNYLRGDVSELDLAPLREFSSGGKFYIYSRFFQHSISEEEQEAMLDGMDALRQNLAAAYFEFRNADDENTKKVFGEHYRRYQTPEYFRHAIERRGFKVAYEVSGKGYAKYFEEDPSVTRVIAVLS
ncbi:class I SAM-dependent methyltransferase [Shinella zoogloeoides]|uniref:class I SAM-dependent methyltransferase n=1 Tax=Shinella zoogloeoides TaxID=352475 RepID=UPI00273FF326|nr:class I SAM-dependent methyltransferase [Shinella zoogloeoides]WLR91328.1 class I SAM-dependent methyltransferase [Shinella zoogloeoides]